MLLMEARIQTLEERQNEHRAILVGDGLEGRGGLRQSLFDLRADMTKKLGRQNLILYALLAGAAAAAPPHIKDIVGFIGKVLAGAP